MASYFLDTEFLEDGKTIELISIGIVAEDGRDAYVQNRNANLRLANPWVHAHVIPQLDHLTCKAMAHHGVGRGVAHCRKRACPWLWRDELSDWFLGFLGTDQAPIFWGYFCAYDWVALCQLYGPMVNIPPGWPYYCRDLRQWLDEHGLQAVKQPAAYAHHALLDAHWIRATWQHYIEGGQA